MGNLTGKVFLVLAFAASSASYADDITEDAARAEARRRFDAGMTAIQSGDYEGGLSQLVVLQADFPNGNTEDNIQMAKACWVRAWQGRAAPPCPSVRPATPPPQSMIRASEDAARRNAEAMQAIRSGDYERGLRELEAVMRTFPHPNVNDNMRVARRCWIALSENRTARASLDREYRDCAPVTGDRYASAEVVQNYRNAVSAYQEGIRLLEQQPRDCAGGIRNLERAQSLLPNASTAYNIRQARRECGMVEAPKPNVPLPRAPAPRGRSLTELPSSNREQAQSAPRVNPDAPSVSCDLVEIARRDGGEGRFDTGSVRGPMGFGHRQGPTWDEAPGVDLSGGVSIDVLTRQPKEGVGSWSNSVRFRQTRGGAPVRVIPVAPSEDGTCPRRPMPARLAVGRSAELLLSDPANRPLEFSDASLQPGQRSAVQRRCFAINDPGSRRTQRYYELSCSQTRRRRAHTPSAVQGNPAVEGGEPTISSGAGAAVSP